MGIMVYSFLWVMQDLYLQQVVTQARVLACLSDPLPRTWQMLDPTKHRRPRSGVSSTVWFLVGNGGLDYGDYYWGPYTDYYPHSPLSTRESSDAEMPRPSVFFSMTAVWRLSSRRKMKRAATALLVCALCRGRLATIGALIIRMGFWDPLYYSCNKEPPK